MDAPLSFQDQLLFHATGQRSGDGLAAVDVAALRPALMAPYRDLNRLRHDYPVVLPEQPGDDGFALPLSTVVSRLAAALAPRGIEGERLRRHLLRLERGIRRAVDAGATGTLAGLWEAVVAQMGFGGGGISAEDETAGRVLLQAARSLPSDGELVACDEAAPARLLTQAWRHAQRRKGREFHALVDGLMRRLSDILRAAWVHSHAGRQPQALQAAVGRPHGEIFDFDAMSRLVARRAPQDELPPARRQRIEWALGVLKDQAFWPAAHAADPLPPGFVFADCAAAAAAYRERLPQVVALVKAIAIAELEADGRYVEAEHDGLFQRYTEDSLTAADLALMPDYLVCIPPERNDAPENAALLDLLSAGMPVKVLVQVSDLLEEASIGTGHFAFGVRSARLATTAMGLGGMFVLQCPGSALPAMKRRVERGMACRGPALFTVFAGSPQPAAELPRYLTAAAAAESRAFPVFTYDAAAGDHWATRFSLEGNRDPEADWPCESFEYADEALQRVVEPVRFTYADFAFTDRRHARHFAVVPRARWHAGMLPVADWLALDDAAAATRVPYLLAVDAEDRLHRVLVDARMMRATKACLLLWRRLQEHGGIHDAYAERARALALAEAAATAAAAAPAAPAVAAPAAVPAAAALAAVALAGVAPAAEPEIAAPPSDEAWIETARCPSCNECQQINPRMFAYNDNKQAYIKDIDAGTYRDLVEAAESCQVAIIHPGKPRNPNEPGLAELIERAKPFL
jgi:ferredoxin